MKYIKLFENFSEEDFPKSITIKLTDKFIRRMEEFKIGDVGKTGFSLPGAPSGKIKLWNNGKSYNMIKIGSLRSDEYNFRDIEKDYWISYHPDKKEVKFDESITTTESRKKYGERSEITMNDDDPMWDNLKLSSFQHGEFENGFKVGEVDHLGYFKIVDIE